MKKFNVSYSITISFDTKVEAKNIAGAVQKVREVIGDDVEIEDAWEVKEKK